MEANESDALLGKGSSGSRTSPEDVFAQFDTDGSGSLTLQEVRAALTKLSLPVDERVERLFNALDTDGNGTLSVDEFVQVCADMDPSTISAKTVAQETHNKANFLGNLGATVAGGVGAATGATTSSSPPSGFQLACQVLCNLAINGGICAYALYVGFKFKADPSATCRLDAMWLIVYGFSFIVTMLSPYLLMRCSDKMQVWGATFFGTFMLFVLGWGIYGITLFFHSEAQKCNRELYLFGYTVAIIYIVVLSMMCCGIVCVVGMLGDKLND